MLKLLKILTAKIIEIIMFLLAHISTLDRNQEKIKL